MDIFVRIVEAGSLTAAANGMGLSLTSVVRALAGLEGQLGVRLLNRTTRRIALTDDGRVYYARCQRIISELDEAEAELSLRRREPSGTLRITAPVMFGRLHVAPAVASFLAAYPSMNAELVLVDRVMDLLEEGMDAAVRIAHLTDSSLVSVRAGWTRRVVCASPAYLDRHGRPETLAALAHHRCIRFTGTSPGTEWEFKAAGKLVRVPIATVMSTNQADAAIHACTEGLGCSLFLDYQVRALLAEGKLERILTPFEPAQVPVSILYPHARLLSPRMRAFLDWSVPRLRDVLRDRG